MLEHAVREALAELGMAAEIDHVTDFAQIAAYGVMTTPALVVDGRVVSSRQGFEKGRGQGADPENWDKPCARSSLVCPKLQTSQTRSPRRPC